MRGMKDGSQYGLKRGGRGLNRTDICRHPELNNERNNKMEKIIKMPEGDLYEPKAQVKKALTKKTAKTADDIKKNILGK